MSEINIDFHSDKTFGTKGTLFVYDDEDNPLFSDTLDIANSKKRNDFIKEVSEKYQGIESEWLETVILQKVSQITRDKQKVKDGDGGESEKDYLKDTPPGVQEAALDI